MQESTRGGSDSGYPVQVIDRFLIVLICHFSVNIYSTNIKYLIGKVREFSIVGVLGIADCVFFLPRLIHTMVLLLCYDAAT